MPRLIVVSGASQGRANIMLDEEVRSVHLETGHAAVQLIERVGWAILDAEAAEAERQPGWSSERQGSPRGLFGDRDQPAARRPRAA